MSKRTNSNNKQSRGNSSRSTMKTKALYCIMAMVAASSSSAFVSQSSSVRTHQPLHAEFSDNGGVALSVDLQKALDSKNASRQKFGLEPLSAPQFLELQSQVAKMEEEQASKAAQM